MKLPLKLSREAWLEALGDARLDLGVRFPTLGSYGPPKSEWAHHARILDEGILYLVVKGGIRARTEKAVWDLTEGTFFSLGPGVWHDLELLNEEEGIRVYHARLNPKIGGRMCWLKEEALVFQHALFLRSYFEEIIDEDIGDLEWKKERQRALFLLVFSSLFRTQLNMKEGLTLGQQTRLTRFVRERIREQPTPAHLAGELGLSPTYFARRFKAAYGVIPRVWLLRERLRIASLQLAETRQGIGEIAEELGYENVSLFSRQFAREFGQSPRVFRQRHWEGQGLRREEER